MWTGRAFGLSGGGRGENTGDANVGASLGGLWRVSGLFDEVEFEAFSVEVLCLFEVPWVDFLLLEGLDAVEFDDTVSVEFSDRLELFLVALLNRFEDLEDEADDAAEEDELEIEYFDVEVDDERSGEDIGGL